MSEIEERRQRAREAASDEIGQTVDGYGDHVDALHAVDAAIETATRVRITPEIERALYAELAAATPGQQHRHARRGLVAAFRAAGFEVEE